jgi:hypothetical protein
MTHSHQSSTSPTVAAYFGGDHHPTIAQTFHPDRGWRRSPGRKRISRSWARQLRREGVTGLQRTDGVRHADFRTQEAQ